MTAETLRRAAALMRERAEAAGRDWNADCEPGDSLHLWVADHDPRDPSGQTATQRLVGGADAPWSEHIASWHPTVALAVADWLDAYAERLEVLGHAIGSNHGQALAVARAYLGEA